MNIKLVFQSGNNSRGVGFFLPISTHVYIYKQCSDIYVNSVVRWYKNYLTDIQIKFPNKQMQLTEESILLVINASLYS